MKVLLKAVHYMFFIILALGIGLTVQAPSVFAADLSFTQSPFIITNNLGTSAPQYEVNLTVNNTTSQNISDGMFRIHLLPYFDLADSSNVMLCDNFTSLSSTNPIETGSIEDGLTYEWNGNNLAINGSSSLCIKVNAVMQTIPEYNKEDFEILVSDTLATVDPCEDLAIYYRKNTFQDTSTGSPLNGGNDFDAPLENAICLKYNEVPVYETAYEDSIGEQVITTLTFGSGSGATTSNVILNSNAFSSLSVNFIDEPLSMCDINDDTCDAQFYVDGTSSFDILNIYRNPVAPVSWYNIDGKIRVAWQIEDAPASIDHFKLSWNEGSGIPAITGTEVASPPNGDAAIPEYSFQGTNLTTGVSTYYSEFTPSDTENGDYIFKLQGCDANGTCSQLFTRHLFIDNLKPETDDDKGGIVDAARNSKKWINTDITHTSVFDDLADLGATIQSGLYYNTTPLTESIALAYIHRTGNPEDYASWIQGSTYPSGGVDPLTAPLTIVEDGSVNDTHTSPGIVQYEQLLNQDGVHYLLGEIRDNADQSANDNDENYDITTESNAPALISSTRKFVNRIAIDKTPPVLDAGSVIINASNLSNVGSCQPSWYHLDVTNAGANTEIVVEVTADDATSGIARSSSSIDGLTYTENGGTANPLNNLSYLGVANPTQWQGDITLSSEGLHNIAIEAIDDANNSTSYAVDINIDSNPPIINPFTLTSASTNPADLALIQTYMDDALTVNGVAATNDGTNTTYLRQDLAHNALESELQFELEMVDYDPLNGSGVEGTDFSGNHTDNGTAWFRYMLQDTFDGTSVVHPSLVNSPNPCINDGTSNSNCWSEWTEAGTTPYTLDYEEGLLNGYTCVDGANSTSGDLCYNPTLINGHHYILWIEAKDCAGNITPSTQGATYSHSSGLSEIFYTTQDMSPTLSPISMNDNDTDEDDLLTDSLTTFFAPPIVAGQDMIFKELFAANPNTYNMADFLNNNYDIFTNDITSDGIPDNRVGIVDSDGNAITTEFKVLNVHNGGYNIGNNTSQFTTDFDTDINFGSLNFSEFNINGASIETLPYIRRFNTSQRDSNGNIISQSSSNPAHSAFDSPSITTPANGSQDSQMINLNFATNPNNFGGLGGLEDLYNSTIGLSSLWNIDSTLATYPTIGSDFINLGLRSLTIYIDNDAPTYSLLQATSEFNTGTAGIYEVFLAIEEESSSNPQYMRIIFEVLPARVDTNNSRIELTP